MAFAWTWLFENSNNGAASAAPSNDSTADRYRLRPMPNEDIHVFIKRIDNTRVVREADPKANASAWTTITSACAFALFVVGLIVPVANTYLAGYTVTEIEAQNTQLRAQLSRLTVRETELTSIDALVLAAKNQRFLDPAPETMVVLNEAPPAGVAANRKQQ